MTSKEISAMREQATDMYKKVWSGQMAAIQRQTKARYDESPDDLSTASEEKEYWDEAAYKLKDVLGVLLTLQCYAEERERATPAEV